MANGKGSKRRQESPAKVAANHEAMDWSSVQSMAVTYRVTTNTDSTPGPRPNKDIRFIAPF